MTARRLKSRGPSKDGKVSVTMFLSESEYAALLEVADRQMRSASAQARWIVVQTVVEKDGGS